MTILLSAASGRFPWSALMDPEHDHLLRDQLLQGFRGWMVGDGLVEDFHRRMEVDLGAAQASVAEDCFEHQQIGATVEGMAGEGVN
jgi:hypothetical protein